MTLDISVCIPTYNQPELAFRAVNSSLAQTGCSFEVIVTDDTRDNAVKNSLEPFFNDPRFHYFKNSEQLGAIGNWNEAAKRANGRIIKILHHDDWFCDNNCLEKMTSPILNGQTPITFSACKAMSHSGNQLFIHNASHTQLQQAKEQPLILGVRNFIGAPSVSAVHRDAFLPFDKEFTWLSDVDFYIRILKFSGRKFIYIHDPLINITVDGNSQLSRDCENKKFRTALEYLRLFSKNQNLHIDISELNGLFTGIGSNLNFIEICKYLYFAVRFNLLDITKPALIGFARKKLRII